MNSARLDVSDESFYEMVMPVARGEIPAEQLTIWFRQRIVEER